MTRDTKLVSKHVAREYRCLNPNFMMICEMTIKLLYMSIDVVVLHVPKRKTEKIMTWTNGALL